jgi:hypothetical protein
MPQDKQLRTVPLERVVEKRRLDQALNAKEFAVLAGVSYSAAREWFRLAGFPVFCGVVFWSDFERWRASQQRSAGPGSALGEGSNQIRSGCQASALSARASRILSQIG